MKHLNLILLVLLLISCQDKKRDKIAHLVSEWQGKEIIFPENIIFTIFGKDTTNYKIPKTLYKVVIYVDSIGCASCKLQLPKWKEMISYTDSLTGKKLSYLFFLHPKDYKEIRYLLKKDNFDLPVCIDTEDLLNKANKFPDNIMFQTFLLDKNNKVIVIGNPVHNPAIKDLYLNQIGTIKKDNALQTTVRVNKTDIYIGTIKRGDSKEAIFQIENIGDTPLVIIDAATTCGCASPSFDKKAVQKGKSLQVKINMTPKNSGLFREVITVKCNTNQQIKLTIRGDAK